jgi:ribosomal protein S18 acetylase RimI-like enzyme
MSLLPEGWRPLRPEDAPAAAALLDEDEVAVGFRSRLGEEEVVDMWAHTDLAHDSWLLEEDCRIAAAGGGQLHAGTYFVRGCVRPGAKGRGLGSVLLDISEGRARAHGVATLHQVALGPDHAADALLRSRGYRDVRRHYEMTIEFADAPPEPMLPAEFSIETFREHDATAWYAAMNGIFQDEWGFELEPFDEWRERHSGDDHSLWFVARTSGEIVGLAHGQAGRRGGGLVNWLGVRTQWRHRGVGRALLLHLLHELRRRGAARAGLGVDAQNPTGATRLYESVGMHVEADHVTFIKELG